MYALLQKQGALQTADVPCRDEKLANATERVALPALSDSTFEDPEVPIFQDLTGTL